VSVINVGLSETDDVEVYMVALSEGRVIVTEDAAGFVPLARTTSTQERHRCRSSSSAKIGSGGVVGRTRALPLCDTAG